jgi:hypothetical protein
MQANTKLIEDILLACLDKRPIDFGRVDEAEVGRAKRAIQKSNGPKLRSFRDPMNRNHFLCGCLDATEDKPEEHLIVGYGNSVGRTTAIGRVHHIVGAQRSVGIPDYVHREIIRHHAHRSTAEVVIFHNHPRTGLEPAWFYVVKALIRDLPIPSRADRMQLQNYAFSVLGIARQLTGQGGIRFYLGESGYVREFSLPLISTLIAR